MGEVWENFALNTMDLDPWPYPKNLEFDPTEFPGAFGWNMCPPRTSGLSPRLFT